MAEKGYEKSLIGVDPVIFTISEGRLNVLLSQREKEPFKGKHELLGGLVAHNETAEETLQRKLKEILGESKIFFTQFFTFTNPKRDPRSRTVSIGYIALINEEKIKPTKNWFDIGKLPQLAFDHKEIIEKAKDYLKENINSLIAKQFLPAKFPLNKLQEVYEIIEQKEYDNRNFRKKMIQSGIVEETEEKQTGMSHRPAKLYYFVR